MPTTSRSDESTYPRSGIQSITATLNGKDISAELLAAPQVGAGRRLELAALDGLRSGRNTVEVTVVMHDGRTQSVSRTVTLDRQRSLPVLSLAGRAHDGGPLRHLGYVGRPTVVDAGASKLASGDLTDADVSWSLVEKPATSTVAVSGPGRRLSFTPDVPGYYRVRATVGRGASATSAVLTVSVQPATTLTPFDAADPANNGALNIGGTLYPVDNDLQLTILDRANLGPASSLPSGLTYRKSYPATSDGVSALSADLTKLGTDSTKLVFVSHPSARAVLSTSLSTALNQALGTIGAAFPRQWLLTMTACYASRTEYCATDDAGWHGSSPPSIGGFTVAGVPGMSAGQAWRATALQGGSDLGRLKGYLIRGLAQETGGQPGYVLVAGKDQYEPVDTCYHLSDAQPCVIKVGDQTYAPTAGVDGWHILVLNRTTLAPVSHTTITAGSQVFSALAPNFPSVGRWVQGGASDQNLVVVQSVGSGRLALNNANLNIVDQFGGTPELAEQSLAEGHPYALVGVANDLPFRGTGNESSPLATPAGIDAASAQTGHVRAMLSRDRNGLLTPSVGDPQGASNQELYPIVYQDPTPWALSGAEYQKAWQAIDQYLGLGNTSNYVRASYTNENLPVGALSGKLSGWTCPAVPVSPGDPTDCGDPADFQAVKAQVLNEFVWWQGTYNMLQNVGTAYGFRSSTGTVQTQDVYNTIAASIPPPPQPSTSVDWLGQFVDITNMASAIAFQTGQDEAGTSIGLLSATGELLSDYITEDDGDSTDDVTASTSEIDNALADQQQAYVLGLDRLFAILVTDQGKLQTVGQKALTPAWSWNAGASLQEATYAANSSTLSQAYASLLPQTWPLYNLKGDGKTQTTSNDVTTYVCSGNPPSPVPIFGSALADNQLHAVTTVDGNGTVSRQVWTYAQLPSQSGNSNYNFNVFKTTVPTTSLSAQLTSTSTLVSNPGGFQNIAQWMRGTYDPPSHVDCGPATALRFGPPTIANAQAAATQ